MDVSHPEILDAVRRALAEDIGSGDITSNLCVPADAQATGCMFARQDLTLAGIELLPLIFPDCQVHLRHNSGARLGDGIEIALVTGPARALLTGERTALNFVQRLSGIATLASAYVAAVEGTGCKILDTRKTTPGLRRLEKMAAAAGGATNHRMGLYDAVLIKNNHISAAGGVRQALQCVGQGALPPGISSDINVEIEVRTRAELDEALACGATHLLLDNLTPAEAREWIAHIARRTSPEKRPTVELSGGITLATVRAYADTGADFVSCGALTHSAPAADLNFRLDLYT
jgi:nicotinate-nucleotide pyrophosphorylase (carboxylating)